MLKKLSDSPKPAVLKSLTIRPSRLADAEAVQELANLPGVRAGTLRPPFQRLEQTKAYLESIPESDLHIVASIDGIVIGNASLRRFAGRRQHAASLGVAVHDEYAGRGIGSALVASLIDAADNWLNLRRIELTVFADNKAAIALYEKFGFKREGILKEYAFRDGGFADVLAMGRLTGAAS